MCKTCVFAIFSPIIAHVFFRFSSSVHLHGRKWSYHLHVEDLRRDNLQRSRRNATGDAGEVYAGDWLGMGYFGEHKGHHFFRFRPNHHLFLRLIVVYCRMWTVPVVVYC